MALWLCGDERGSLAFVDFCAARVRAGLCGVAARPPLGQRPDGGNAVTAARVFAMAVGFLTCLPVPAATVAKAHLGWVVAVFPLVGALLGAALVAAAHAFGSFVQPDVAALAVVALWMVATAGLHVDGVADLSDALGAAHASPEKRLAIMKDPRVGAHGAAGVAVLVLAKWLGVRGAIAEPMVLFTLPVAVRGAIALLIAVFPPARADGLGRGFRDAIRWQQVAVASVLAVAPFFFFSQAGIGGALVALGVMLVLALVALRKLGGLTGDVYGAAIEAGEVAGLLALGIGI